MLVDPVLAVLFRYCESAPWLVSVASTAVAFGSWLILSHGAALLFLLLDAFQPTLTGAGLAFSTSSNYGSLI